MKKEEWKEIPGYDGLYEVSNHGNVRSWKNNKWGKAKSPRNLKAIKTNGYPVVNLSKNGNTKTFYVHRLVAKAFVFPQPKNKLHVLHKDDIRDNNMSTNLYWGDDMDNKVDRVRNSGPINQGENHGMAKYTKEDVKEIKRLYYEEGLYQKDIAKEFDTVQQTISEIVTGRNWGHVQ